MTGFPGQFRNDREHLFFLFKQAFCGTVVVTICDNFPNGFIFFTVDLFVLECVTRFFFCIKDKCFPAGGNARFSLAEIEIQADSIAILKKGRLLAQGSVPQLCERTGINTRVQLDVEARVADELVAKLGERYPVKRVAEAKLEFSCLNGDKLKLLEDLFGSGVRLQDIRIQTPRLDDIYSYYMEGRHE